MALSEVDIEISDHWVQCHVTLSCLDSCLVPIVLGNLIRLATYQLSEDLSDRDAPSSLPRSHSGPYKVFDILTCKLARQQRYSAQSTVPPPTSVTTKYSQLVNSP